MSSDRAPAASGVLRDPALHARFSAQLARALPADLQPLSPFFADLSRLETLASLLDRHLDHGPGGRAQRILNLGCGPMVTELFCGVLQGRQFVSVDYTPAFVDFGKALQSEGLLPDVTILQADVTVAVWPPGHFDAILMHDLLYEDALDVAQLLPRLEQFLAPGGLVVFDVMDARLRGLWRLMGREHGYRRYRMAEVEAALQRAGLTEIDRRPAAPRAGLARAAIHRCLRTLGLSNAVAFAARKGGAGP
jgi:SAM-dependent methyltransferase